MLTSQVPKPTRNLPTRLPDLPSTQREREEIEMTKVKQIKRNIFLSGMTSAGIAWGVTLYFTLVSNGFLNSPWTV